MYDVHDAADADTIGSLAAHDEPLVVAVTMARTLNEVGFRAQPSIEACPSMVHLGVP